MQYVNYEEAIVQRYGIELQGWTYDKLVNPSELSTAVDPLRKLLNAINSGDCKFVKLMAEERRKRQETYNAKIASGELKARTRKTRSDSGKKKKRIAVEGPEISADDSHSSDDSNGGDDGDGSVPHEGRCSSAKRRRISGQSVSVVRSDSSAKE
jgi:hypothetical protein